MCNFKGGFCKHCIVDLAWKNMIQKYLLCLLKPITLCYYREEPPDIPFSLSSWFRGKGIPYQHGSSSSYRYPISYITTYFHMKAFHSCPMVRLYVEGVYTQALGARDFIAKPRSVMCTLWCEINDRSDSHSLSTYDNSNPCYCFIAKT